MNKLITTIVSVALLSLALAACGKKEGDAQTEGGDVPVTQDAANALPQDKAGAGGGAVPNLTLDGG